MNRKMIYDEGEIKKLISESEDPKIREKINNYFEVIIKTTESFDDMLDMLFDSAGEEYKNSIKINVATNMIADSLKFLIKKDSGLTKQTYIKKFIKHIDEEFAD